MTIEVEKKQQFNLKFDKDFIITQAFDKSFSISLTEDQAKTILSELQSALYPDCEVTYTTKTVHPFGVTMGEYKVLGNTTYGAKDYVGGLRWNEYGSDGKHITCQCKGTLRFEGDRHPTIDDSHAEKIAKEAYDQIKTVL